MRIKQIKEQDDVLTPEKARLIARLKADGSVFISNTDYTASYDTADHNEAMRFASDIKTVYGLEPRILRHRSGKVPTKKLWKVAIRSKKMFEDLRKYGEYYSHNWKIPEQIFESDKEVKRMFLRTLFEDEGTIPKTRKIIRFYSINLEAIKQVKLLLNGFGLDSKIRGGFGWYKQFSLDIKGSENSQIYREY